jgi:hypothetical protein
MKTDQNRIYLEDIGEIVMSRGGKDIWLVKGITKHEDFKDRCLPERIYVVDFPGRGVGEEKTIGTPRINAPEAHK